MFKVIRGRARVTERDGIGRSRLPQRFPNFSRLETPIWPITTWMALGTHAAETFSTTKRGHEPHGGRSFAGSSFAARHHPFSAPPDSTYIGLQTASPCLFTCSTSSFPIWRGLMQDPGDHFHLRPASSLVERDATIPRHAPAKVFQQQASLKALFPSKRGLAPDP